MESNRRQSYFIAAVLAAMLAGGGYVAYRQRPVSPQAVGAHIAIWPSGPRMTAELMMERYGPPDAIAPGSATWYERGPWKRIVVKGDSPDKYLEQAVSYRIPYMAILPLFEFGHGVRADTANNELSVSSDDETLNHLALNLADDIASGKRTAREAQKVYAETARFAAAGKSSPYTEALRFAPHRAMPEDAWRRVIGY